MGPSLGRADTAVCAAAGESPLPPGTWGEPRRGKHCRVAYSAGGAAWAEREASALLLLLALQSVSPLKSTHRPASAAVAPRRRILLHSFLRRLLLVCRSPGVGGLLAALPRCFHSPREPAPMSFGYCCCFVGRQCCSYSPLAYPLLMRGTLASRHLAPPHAVPYPPRLGLPADPPRH